ncbi:MAG TPA: hypothetical protein IAA03_03850 [Candidatus Ruminococcus avistercoris]|nr:hypothetical protein [Candidatus Ruminococcus avistercoris]
MAFSSTGSGIEFNYPFKDILKKGDKYTNPLDVTGYSKAMKKFADVSIDGGDSLEKFKKQSIDAKDGIADYTSQLNGASGSFEDYTKYVKEANEAQKKLTLGQKAASAAKSFGSSLLSNALNIGTGMLAGVAISGVISLIDSWVHRSENLIEAGKQAESEIQSLNQEYGNHKTTVESVIDSYDALRSKVDMKTNRNMGLTSTEYQQFLDQNNQLAEMFPTLVDGYDSQGNAIINLGSSAASASTQLNKLLEAERKSNNYKIAEQAQTQYEGVAEQVKKLEEANIALEREAKNNESVSKQLSKNNIADSIGDGFYSIDAYSADGKKAYDALRKALRDNDVWYEANQIDDGKGGSEYRFTIGEMDAKTKADVIAQFESETHDLAWSYQDAANASFKQIKFNENEIAAKWAELRPTAEAMLETSPAFTEMDQTLQDGISSMLGNVDYSTIESKFGGDIEKFVREGMIAPIAMAGDQTQEAWKQLFALEGQREELTVEEWANRRDKLLNQITGGDKEQLKEISQNLGYLNSEGKGKVKQELDEMVGHLYDDIDSPEAKAFRENLKDLTGEDYEIALDLILNDDDHSIETIQDLRNEIADAKEELADEAFSFDNMTTALENAVEAQTKINQAVQNSNSSTGLLTEDVSNLATAFNEVAGYDTDVLLEKTASGLRLNRDALAAYQAEQEKNIKTNFEKSIQKQNEALVEQQKILNDASRTQDEKDVAQAEINTIQSQIEQLELMRAQYNGLTSDYAKWMNALSNGEEGDIYDTVATNWQAAKQAAEDGWIGTDEFKRAVDYMYSGSLDNQTPQEVKAVYDELNGLVSGWYQFDDDGNLLGMQSLKQFVSDAETLDDVLGKDVQTSFEQLEDGTYKATLNAQEFADAWGVSEEVITDLAGKMRDAGWDVEVTGVTSDFALMAETAEEAQEIVSNITGQTYEFDFKTTSLEKAREQLQQAEEQLSHFRNEDGSYNMDAEGASEAAQVYEYSARKEQQLSKPSISSVDSSSVAQSSQEFVEAAQNFQTAKDELDVQTQLAAQGLPNNLEQATADAQDSLSVLQDLQKAGKVPFDIDTSGLQEAEDGLQGLSDEEIKAKIGADTSQAQSDIQSLEGSSVTIHADVSTEGGAQDLASDFAALPEGIATTVTVDVQGEEQVENLTTAMESAPDNTPVTIKCNVENAEQLATINEQAAKLNEAGKEIKIDATIGEVDTSAIEGTEQNVDVKGQLTTVEGTEGQELTVDIKGNLTEISGAEGQELTVDVKGNLTEVSGGDGQTVNIDATANITNVTGVEEQQVNIDATVNPPDVPDVSGGTVEYDSVVEPPDVPDVEGGTVHYRSVVDPPTVPTASGVVNYTKGTVETANGQVSTGTINYNKGNVESADGTVSTGIINYDLGSVASADGTVSTGIINYALGSVAKPNGATATGVINYTLGSVARPAASGTMLSPAHADGTAYNVLNYKNAYANGKVSLPKNETALVNELGGLMPSLNLSNAGISLELYILQHSHEIRAGVNV